MPRGDHAKARSFETSEGGDVTMSRESGTMYRGFGTSPPVSSTRQPGHRRPRLFHHPLHHLGRSW